MAPGNAKPWKQQAPVLVAVLLLLGLTLPLPGSAAPLDDCCNCLRLLAKRVLGGNQCQHTILAGLGLSGSTASQPLAEEDVRKCCRTLGNFISVSRREDCACGLRMAFAERKIDVDRVCKLDMTTKEKCQAKEDAEKAKAEAPQRREDELTKLGPCDRLFERLDAGEFSKISRDGDIMACRQMKTCGAS